MSYLVLVRHGKSEWNEKGLWTGWTDISLSDKGKIEAKQAGEAILDLPIDLAYTSDLLRAKQTLDIILETLNKKAPITEAKELKERDYGDLTGKNKWKIKEEYGEDQFMKWRRGWDTPIPGGESLKDVYFRTIPYYEKEIEPKLKEEKNILISAHGNSLRALVKKLENISDDEISKLEIGTGEVYIYKIDENGKVISKEIRSTNPDKLKV